MKLHHLAAVLLIAGCTIPPGRPTNGTIVQVSDGINFVVHERADGLWEATPRAPRTFLRWGDSNAIEGNVKAIEIHTGCTLDRDRMITANLSTRGPLVCRTAR